MLIERIRECFGYGKVYYSMHARAEMENEEFGEIQDHEVYEVVLSGKVIESYPKDVPYPSCLIYGATDKGRPLHAVCAYSEEDDLAIIITVYQPDPRKWVGYERRIK